MLLEATGDCKDLRGGKDVGGRALSTTAGTMIAGSTSYDANEAALCAVLAEWTPNRSCVARVANLRGTGTGSDFANRLNGNIFLRVTDQAASTTVFDDGVADVLTGGPVAGQIGGRPCRYRTLSGRYSGW
jgi:hypothetical protein